MLKLIFALFLTTNIGEANMTNLKECPNSPNCVSTQTEQAEKKMDPVPYTDTLESATERIKTAISGQKQSKLIKQEGPYLHFTFTSRVFGFVDDVEFLLDDEKKLIHFRSASRTGYGDMGVNRKRMQAISKALLK